MTIVLLKSIACMFLLWAFYRIFLRNENLYRFNRGFLLFSILAATVIPWLSIPIDFIETNIPVNDLTGINLAHGAVMPNSKEIWFDLWRLLYLVYVLVSLGFLIRFLRNLRRVYTLVRKSDRLDYANHTLVLMDRCVVPFAFLSYIFIDKEEYRNNKVDELLIQHELQHVIQRHSYDVLFVEFVQIVLWINPVFHWIKKDIKANHEFLADTGVIRSADLYKYQNLLLSVIAHDTKTYYLASNFNYSITKKRIEMMTKFTSKRRALFRKIMSATIIVAVVFLFSNHSMAQSKGVSEEMMKEYKQLELKYSVYRTNLKVLEKDLDRMIGIYQSMDDEQRNDVSKPMQLIPTPPPPPEAPTAPDAPLAPPPPPPPPSSLPRQAMCYIDGKKVTYEEATSVLERNENVGTINIYEDEESGKITVQIRTKQ